MASTQRPLQRPVSDSAPESENAAGLYLRFYPSALRFARSLTHDLASAEDLASDAFLRVWERIRAGTNPHNMQSYLLTTVRNLYLDRIRARRHLADVDPVDEEGAVVEHGLEDSVAEHMLLVRAMNALSPLYRDVLIWTVLEGVSNASVAARLGINANACSSLTFRARQALRSAYFGSSSDLGPEEASDRAAH